MRTTLTAILLAVAACSTPAPTPDPVPVPDVSYEQACAHLHELGCEEGELDNCARVLQRMNEEYMAVVPTACIGAAQTVEAVRACPGIRCRVAP